METVFGILTKGVIESRKSMLYGPFCCIYGMGAVFLLCIPSSIKEKKYKLLIYGMLIGSAVEYVVSWVGEMVFNLKWWDYSNYPFNINGRVCLLFAVIWGLCTLSLNKIFNPQIDKIINMVKRKFSRRFLHGFLTILTIIIIADNLISSFALKMFYTRLIHDYKIENVEGADKYYNKYISMYENNQTIRLITDKLFSYKTMILTFPNIKLSIKGGKDIWIRDILKDIQPYYVKLFETKNNLFYITEK